MSNSCVVSPPHKVSFNQVIYPTNNSTWQLPFKVYYYNILSKIHRVILKIHSDHLISSRYLFNLFFFIRTPQFLFFTPLLSFFPLCIVPSPNLFPFISLPIPLFFPPLLSSFISAHRSSFHILCLQLLDLL